MARYLVQAFQSKPKHKVWMVYSEQTEDPEIIAKWTATLYPNSQVKITDRYSGEVRIWKG